MFRSGHSRGLDVQTAGSIVGVGRIKLARHISWYHIDRRGAGSGWAWPIALVARGSHAGPSVPRRGRSRIARTGRLELALTLLYIILIRNRWTTTYSRQHRNRWTTRRTIPRSGFTSAARVRRRLSGMMGRSRQPRIPSSTASTVQRVAWHPPSRLATKPTEHGRNSNCRSHES